MSYRNHSIKERRLFSATKIAVGGALALAVLAYALVPVTWKGGATASDQQVLSLGTRPDASNTGPRIDEATMPVMTTAQAIAQLCATKQIVGAKITGMLKISDNSCAKQTGAAKAATGGGQNWVIRDSIIEVQDGLYGVQAFISQVPFTGTMTQRPLFDHVEVRGGAVTGHKSTSALFYGSDTVWRNSNLYGGIDIFKPYERVTIEDSYAHSLDHPEGAHSDIVQIREGKDILIQRNNFVSKVAYGVGIGANGNGVLQTGSMSGTLTNAQWIGNWFAGGHYTIRTEGVSTGYAFAGNKFSRDDYTYGVHTGYRSHFFTDGINTNVWEDTGEPIFTTE